MSRQRHPIITMARMEALCQWDLAVAARVRGMRIREMAAERRRRPIMSREYQRDLRPPRTL